MGKETQTHNEWNAWAETDINLDIQESFYLNPLRATDERKKEFVAVMMQLRQNIDNAYNLVHVDETKAGSKEEATKALSQNIDNQLERLKRLNRIAAIQYKFHEILTQQQAKQ